jgi:hypothetical protein
VPPARVYVPHTIDDEDTAMLLLMPGLLLRLTATPPLLLPSAARVSRTLLPPPPPPIVPCFGASSEPCLPKWRPTWHMRNSTVLYACNVSGMHSVKHAIQFGTVVYDCKRHIRIYSGVNPLLQASADHLLAGGCRLFTGSNARALWTNAHPMSSEELLTKQAEMVYAADPGMPGHAPRVWV